MLNLVRDGYRVIDTDTHVGPTADVLYDYGSAALTAGRAELAPYEFPIRDGIGLSISPVPVQAGDGREAGGRRGRQGRRLRR